MFSEPISILKIQGSAGSASQGDSFIGRLYPHQRGQRAQPQERERRHPEGQVGGHNGAVGVRQVVPGVRHALCRGAAALRGVPVGLRAPVSGRPEEAGRGRHLRPVPRHLHRTEGDGPQPAFHRRDRHRDLRLPAPALRPHRGAPLPPLRQAGHPLFHRRDPGADLPERRRFPRGDPLPARPGQEGRVPQPVQPDAGEGLYARPRRRTRTSSWTRRSATTSRWSSTG